MTKFIYSAKNPGATAAVAATASLATNASADLNYAIAESGILVSFTANRACLVRVYDSAAARVADVRAYNLPVPAAGIAGLIVELEIDPTIAATLDRESSVAGGRDGWNMLYAPMDNSSVIISTERAASGVFTPTIYTTLTKDMASYGWHYFAGSTDPSLGNRVAVLDGVVVGEVFNTGASASITNASKNLTLMLRGGFYINALLAVVRVYNRMLSKSELLRNYASEKGYYL